jgi:predicted SprT family Zn-dependent metalloprotease
MTVVAERSRSIYNSNGSAVRSQFQLYLCRHCQAAYMTAMAWETSNGGGRNDRCGSEPVNGEPDNSNKIEENMNGM